LLLAISATFTAEAIQPGLAFWMRELGLPAEIRFAAYNQVFQELLDPAGLLASNAGGVNVVLVRFDDWPAGQAAEFVDAVRAAAGRMAVPLIVVLCPGALEFDDEVRRGVAGLPSVYLLTAAEIAELYPVAEVHDPDGNELGRVPYTPLYFVALATALARKIHAITAPPFKAIALDCDDTLWAGICGEDGPEGVVLDPPRRRLQEFMAERRRAGLLLALCSKNNEEDVAATFRAHPEMPLGPGDFVARRINWDSKAGNLASLAEELELGLDTFILVDDNPKEVQEVQAGAPQVLALLLPARAEGDPGVPGARVGLRPRARHRGRPPPRRNVRPAGGAGARGAQFGQPGGVPGVARTRSQDRAHGAGAGGPRGATHRAHQPDECHLHPAQRGGNRAPERGVPHGPRHRPLRQLWPDRRDALSRGGAGAGGGHVPAELPRVGPRRGASHGGAPGRDRRGARPADGGDPVRGGAAQSSRAALPGIARRHGRGGVFRLSAADAARSAVTNQRWGGPLVRGPPLGMTPRGQLWRNQRSAPPARADYARIATLLRTPEQIFAALRATSRRRTSLRDIDAPRTALERDLVALWAELLNVEAVGIHENFFELGGHSLLAVQLLSRVRQIYGVDLSLEVVYSGEFMVAELAKAIELKEIEQAGGDYRELIEELEGLSDAEVRALLAEEQDAT
jgi:HAD superfamily phosphatase (TIGR01681 family)